MNASRKPRSFFDLFPIPNFLLLSQGGLDLSEDGIRFVRFKRSRKLDTLDLERCSMVPIADGVLEGGFVHNKDTLVSALKEFKRHEDIRFVRVALPEEKGYLFTTVIESVPTSGLKDAVAFILEENVPVSLPDAIFSTEIIGMTTDGKLRIAVAVVHTKVVEIYLDVLQAAGLVPVAFDFESQAIARSVVKKGGGRTELIVNLGERKTGLYMVEDEVVQSSFTPLYGVRQEQGSNKYPDMNDLKTEIRKLLAFWNTRLDKQGIPVRKVEHIIVCGIGASRADFVQELLGGFDIGFELANVWINAFSLKEEVPKISYEESLGYAAAAGLALPFEEKNYV